MESTKFFLVMLSVLVVPGAVMLWKLVRIPPQPAPVRIVATKDLPGLTLLKKGDLKDSSDSKQAEEKLAQFTDRYLLVSLRKGFEIKPQMVASHEQRWLSNAVEVSLPSSAWTTLGGQVHVGDSVDLIAASPNPTNSVKKIENLLVLSVVIGSKDASANAITFALPSERRDEFAAAVAGAQLLVTRRLTVK